MRNALFLGWVMAGPFMVGCASSGNNYDDSKVSTIQNGVTTEPQLVAMFGDPSNRVVNSDGTTQLSWNYNQVKADKRQFIPYAGALWAGNAAHAEKMLHVTLHNGVVSDYSSSSGGMENRQGTQVVPHS